MEPPRPGFEDAVWFRIDFGRNKNAEARWILPMICRRGHVTKNEIGAIRIFERETRFQISGTVVEQFEAVAAKGGGDGGNIERLGEDAPPPPRDRNMSSSRHRAISGENDAPSERVPRPRPNYAERKERRDGPGAPPARHDDFLRAEFAKPAPAPEFKRPDYKKDFKKPDFKKPDFKKDDFKKATFKPDRPPPAERAAWTPPLDSGDAQPPAKALKAKKAKKRKANGKGGLF